jgi:DNA invertase Pin-like site-specific DNA recombinase
MKRVAVYLPPDTEPARRQKLMRLARAHGLDPVIYQEPGPGRRRRPVFEQMMTDAREGTVAAVCVARLDDLGRRFSCCEAVRELATLNVPIYSVNEPWAEAAPREFLAAFMAWAGKVQSDHQREKTKNGLERARRRGVHIGRPRLSPHKLQEAAADVAGGMSQRAAAKKAGISEGGLRGNLKLKRAREEMEKVAVANDAADAHQAVTG